MSISVNEFVELKRKMEERMTGFEEAIAELKASNAHLQGLLSQMSTRLAPNMRGGEDSVTHDASNAHLQGLVSQMSTRLAPNMRGGEDSIIYDAIQGEWRRVRASRNEPSHDAMRNVRISNLTPSPSSITMPTASTRYSASANPYRMPPTRRYPYMNHEVYENAIILLPTEIRWKVFGFLTKSIGEMRLVCKSWHAMVDEWLVPENIPAFSVIDIKEDGQGCMNVGIEFHKREAACFESLRNLAEEHDSLPEELKRMNYRTDFARISFDIPYGAPTLDRLRSIIGTKSGQIHITRPLQGGSRFYNSVRTLLGPVNQANELILWRHYIDNHDTLLLMDLTSHIAVRKMSFTMDISAYPQEFLHDISERVEYFSIKLQDSEGRRRQTVGARGASWVELILGMFLCGACSIDLNNFDIELFSSEDMERIVEMLVNRNLPFHLKMYLHHLPSRALVKAVKELQKRITQSGGRWVFNISSKPPPAHAEVMFVTVKQFAELKRKMEEAEKRIKCLEEALAEMKAAHGHQKVLQEVPASNSSPTQSSFTRHGSAYFSTSTTLTSQPSPSLPDSTMNSRNVTLGRHSAQQEVKETFFPLSSLPSEIRWKIFGLLTESIGRMRQVSKSWRAMVDEWAIPENLPALSLIDITEVTATCMNVGIEFLKREAACFGMLRDLGEELGSYPEQSRDEGDCVRIAFDIPYGSPELERLRSCIGTKSRKVDIAKPKSGPERNGELSIAFYGAVAKFLEPLKEATNLRLFQHWLNNGNSQLLKNLTAHIYVRMMHFTVDVQTNPQDFLLDISERVEYFDISLVNSQARSIHNKSSVRDKSASWVEMILAMFHCRACSIHLDTYHVDLFSSDNIECIVELLENRGSPFQLKVVLHQEPARTLAKSAKNLRKDIRIYGNICNVNITSKPPPAHAVDHWH